MYWFNWWAGTPTPTDALLLPAVDRERAVLRLAWLVVHWKPRQLEVVWGLWEVGTCQRQGSGMGKAPLRAAFEPPL